MTKNLALAASMMVLIALSGPAFARTSAPEARYQAQMTEHSAFGAFDQMTTPAPVAFNTHRYEGGPKSND
jgi:ATP-dependent protease ClpP protease subunit